MEWVIALGCAFLAVFFYAAWWSAIRTIAGQMEELEEVREKLRIARTGVAELAEQNEELVARAERVDGAFWTQMHARVRIERRLAAAVSAARKHMRSARTYRECFWTQQEMTGKSRTLILKLSEVLMPERTIAATAPERKYKEALAKWRASQYADIPGDA